MMHDTGTLRAYLDGELLPVEADLLVQHLADCARCRNELEALRGRAKSAALSLHALPSPAAEPDARAALARLYRSTEHSSARFSVWDSLLRSFEMAKKNLMTPRWRPLTIALSVVLALAILMSIAPVREAAADFLGLFRVRKFAVIPIDPAQVQRLESIAQQAESVLGEPTVLREEGPRQAVTDAAQASSLAGFAVRLPAELPENAQQRSFTVQSGPAVRFEVQRAVLESLMQAAGASTAGLPQTDTISATVDVPTGVSIEYAMNGGSVQFLQVPSPQVSVPEGVDVVALSETGFQFLGIPPEEAHRLATTIDWTSTLVIPLPTDLAQAQEVTVDGSTGLLIQSGTDRHGPDDLGLLWERDGILYVLGSSNLDQPALLRIAGSLQ